MITINDMERTIAELFPREMKNVEMNEPILLDYKVGSNKKGDQLQSKQAWLYWKRSYSLKC